MSEEGQMNDVAVTQHEMFLSYVKAGFTEKQALTLIVAWIQKSAEGGAETS